MDCRSICDAPTELTDYLFPLLLLSHYEAVLFQHENQLMVIESNEIDR